MKIHAICTVLPKDHDVYLIDFYVYNILKFHAYFI